MFMRCTPVRDAFLGDTRPVEMHDYEMPTHEMHAWEMHVYEMPAYEMYAWEMHARRDARL